MLTFLFLAYSYKQHSYCQQNIGSGHCCDKSFESMPLSFSIQCRQ